MKKIFLFLCIISYTSHSQSIPVNPTIDSLNKRLTFTSKDHLTDFMNYYGSQEGSMDSIVAVFETNGFESLMNEALRVSKLTANSSPDFVDDDELIGDDRLASLLNPNREIIVGQELFRYEAEGVYFANINTVNLALQMPVSKALATSVPLTPSMPTPSGMSQIVEQENVAYNLGNDVCYYKFDYANSIDYQNSPEPNAINTVETNNSNEYPYIDNINYCRYQEQGFWESIFPGEQETCRNYINDGKRIRTKVSNQSYWIFTRTFASVKSQQRKHFGFAYWKRKSFCEYIEMGRTIVIKYPLLHPKPPLGGYNGTFYIKDNYTNHVRDGQGNVISYNSFEQENIFELFPFDSSSFNYEIYYYIGTYTPKASDINKLLVDAIKGLLKGLGKSSDQLFGANGFHPKIGMTIDSPDAIYVVEYGNRIRHTGGRHICQEYGDNSIMINIKAPLEGFLKDAAGDALRSLINPAKTPEVVVVDVYGIGRYQGVTYGSRIGQGRTYDPVTGNEIDSDGDGIPDVKDLCPYQAGTAKNNGCRFSLKKEETLHSIRVNNFSEAPIDPSYNSASYSFGGCEDVILTSSNYPVFDDKISGGNYINYDIVGGKSVSIKSGTSLTVKPEGITESICLKIQNNACNFVAIPAQKRTKKKITSDNTDIELMSNSENDVLEVYPNPFSDLLNVKYGKGILNYSLVNAKGQVLLFSNNVENNNVEINTENLTSGMYFLSVQLSDGEKVYKKVIKY